MGTTQAIPNVGKLRPGQKGIPLMVPWGAYLFVARNRTDGVAEVWRYNAASGWLKVIATNDATNGMNPNNSAVSLLTINGAQLYLGFDNETDGAELWRTTGSVPADLLDHDDIEKVGLSGFGPAGAADLIRNKHLMHEEGVALVHRFDGEFPEKYFKEVMREIGMAPEHFVELCDKFRSPHLWKQKDGQWTLRQQVV